HGREFVVYELNVVFSTATCSVGDDPPEDSARTRRHIGNGSRGRINIYNCGRTGNQLPRSGTCCRDVRRHKEGTAVALLYDGRTSVRYVGQRTVGQDYLVSIRSAGAILNAPFQSDRRTGRNTGYGGVVSGRICDCSAARYDTPGAGTYCRIGRGHGKDAVVTLLLVDARNGRGRKLMVGQYNIRSTFRTHAIVDRPAQRRRRACRNTGNGSGRRGRVGNRSRSRNNAPSTFPHNRGIGTHDKGAVVTLFNRTSTRVRRCRGCQVGNHNLVDIVGTRAVLHAPFQSHRRTGCYTGYGGVVSRRICDGSAA